MLESLAISIQPASSVLITEATYKLKQPYISVYHCQSNPASEEATYILE